MVRLYRHFSRRLSSYAPDIFAAFGASVGLTRFGTIPARAMIHTRPAAGAVAAGAGSPAQILRCWAVGSSLPVQLALSAKVAGPVGISENESR